LIAKIIKNKNKMKRSLITLLFCFIFYASNAQTTIKPTVGINLSDFSQDANGEAKAQLGWQFGGSIVFGKKVYVEPGIFWVGKSTEYTSSGSTNPNLNIDLKGIRIPLTVGINLLGSEKTAFGVRGFGGASAFFITSEGGVPTSIDINKSNFGVFAGAGLDIWKIFVDLSYEWSVTDIQKEVNLIDFGKTRSLFINAGIRINL
jgi:hypothetical protein